MRRPRASRVTDSLERDYATLEIRPGCSPPDIKQAYLLLLKVWHPDRFLHDPALEAHAQEKTKEITAAYQRIKDAPLPAAGATGEKSLESPAAGNNQTAPTGHATHADRGGRVGWGGASAR